MQHNDHQRDNPIAEFVALDPRRRVSDGVFTIEPVDWESPVFRDDVVPDEDNPLRGWRRVGADLLPQDLWPVIARHNPVIAYFTGRRRGALAEDLIGLLPWILLIMLELLIFAFLASIPSDVILCSVIVIGVAPILAAFWTGIMTGMHIRGALTSLPLEELMLTPLKPENLVQGLSLRPLSVQAAAQLAFVLVNIPVIIIGDTIVSSRPGMSAFLYATVGSFLLWIGLRLGNEMGGSFATRAHFCIRDPWGASQRVVYDLMREGVAPVLAVPLALALFLAVGNRLPGDAFLWVIGVVGAFLLFALIAAPFFLFRYLRARSSHAMTWTWQHPEEWWPDEGGSGHQHEQQRSMLPSWGYHDPHD